MLTTALDTPAMRIEKRTLGWFPKVPTLQYVQAQNAKRRAQIDRFLSSQNDLANQFSTISANRAVEEVNIASRLALARIRKQA